MILAKQAQAVSPPLPLLALVLELTGGTKIRSVVRGAWVGWSFVQSCNLLQRTMIDLSCMICD